MYNTRFQKQLDESQRRIFGVTRQPPSREEAYELLGRYQRSGPTIPCYPLASREWVAIPRRRRGPTEGLRWWRQPLRRRRHGRRRIRH